MQSVWPSIEYSLTEQAVIAPVDRLQLTPAGQFIQAMRPATGEYCPYGQLCGGLSLSGHTLPLGQGAHTVCPCLSWY